ncbi:hypothetical protein I3760_02G171900 [Carya illinoinensis]|nr:hypothetical protein I3760_02G171900 [Carya illinoinensis]KAG6665613.1 hypothetical protein CIPAW_02G172600 [Carya illinoinensis]
MTLLHLLLLLNPPLLLILVVGSDSTNCVAAATRPLEYSYDPPNYVSLKPKRIREGGFRDPDTVSSCLPKGFRRSSAPSRYVNYHTLGSTVCSPGKRMARP